MIERFAAIADIHGNADALSAVLADIDMLGVSEIIGLGDYFSGPLDAEGTARILSDRPMRAIRGNHDRYLISEAPGNMGVSDRIAFDQLPDSAMHWLEGMSPFLSLGEDLLACHGTPYDDNDFWAETMDQDGRVTLKEQDQIEDIADNLPHKLFLCGHSHLPRVTQMSGGRLLVNPGSVGCPDYKDGIPLPDKVKAGGAHASYAVLEHGGDGWRVDLRLVPYDSTRMASLARGHGREDRTSAVERGLA
ncbi:metallophosphoesterase family protein [Thalassovita aquimarina]|uniref:metallophosphoesterase family protein n=1 Tax=Thalassovita aquimarina TaxID=2785917 RepID=UPI00356AB9C8